MKNNLLLFLLAFPTQFLFSQSVGIGTSTPHFSAALDVRSTTKGLLMPSMTTTQRNAIFLPANGLMVYDTDLKEIYCHNGVQWKKVSGTDTWSSNSIRPWTYTFTDSVGIGTTVPTQRLDVAGNIRSRNNLLVDKNITASNAILAGGNFSAVGTGFVVGEITTNSGVTINNSAGALTLKTGLEDKGFVQLSGNDIRVGTFSNNNAGKFVVRTGGSDQLFVNNTGNVGIDISSPLAKLHIINGADASYSSNGYLMLGPVTGTNLLIDNNEILARNNGGPAILSIQNSGGSTQMGVGSGTINFASTGKVARNGISGSADLLPICYGKVSNNGTILGGTNNFSVSRSSTGNYVITLTNEPDLTANQDNYSILVTPFYKTSSSGESSAASIIATISSNNTILINARKFKLTFDNFLCNCYGEDQLFSLLTTIPIYSSIDVSFSFMIYKM